MTRPVRRLRPALQAGKIPEERTREFVEQHFDPRPAPRPAL